MPSNEGMPEEPDVLTRLDALIAQGARPEALTLIDQLTQADPSPRMACECAMLLMDMDEAARAVRLLAPFRQEGHGGARLMTLLGRAQLASGASEAAIHTLREATYIDGQSIEALIALGEAQIASDALPDAIATLERALRIDRDATGAHFKLGEAWALLDETAKATRAYEAALATDPGDARGAALRLAEMKATAAPRRASSAYVRHLFDGYAPRYDAHMTGALSYRGPQILAALAEPFWGEPAAKYEAMDLGCGTGLSGAVFRPWCRRLMGVDLSPRMVAAAEASGHYDDVQVGELVSALATREDDLDLAIACDTIIYLGDLASLFQALQRALKSGGWFLFSAEKMDASMPGDYEIGPTRRFRHARAYLESLARDFGFSVSALEDTSLRTEKRLAVPAFAGLFRKL